MGRRRNSPRKLTVKERTEELRAFIALCFALLDGDDNFQGMAELSGLALSTIYRLSKGNATLRTHFGTVQALGYSVGLRLEMNEYKVNVRIVG